MNENNMLSKIPQTLTTMQTQDKKLPFVLILFFIDSAKPAHRRESERKSSNIMFSDDELVIIAHLEQAATDLRCANPELLEQAKRILAESPYVPSDSFRRSLLASTELLLIEVRARQKNPALYDFLYSDTLWYFHNRDRLPYEVVKEIDHYLISHYPEKYSPPLFDAFWRKGELAFMFGSAGIGKSILAVQIADAVSRGAKIQCFDGPQTPMKVGLFDFELSGLQHLNRYSDENGNRYKFSPNFLRTEISVNAEIPKGVPFQDLILEEIEKRIIKHRLEVVIIDNLTALLNITETKYALELMHELRLLKLRQNISMLVIGKTPKRDLTKPITQNDIADSMHLLNLCDSAFCIGESLKESNVRYLKQIKARNAEFKYDSDNVATFRVVKNGPYRCFEHIGFHDEEEHLCVRTE